jgi:hypothetical protein
MREACRVSSPDHQTAAAFFKTLTTRREGSTVHYSPTGPHVSHLLGIARRILSGVLAGQIGLLDDLNAPAPRRRDWAGMSRDRPNPVLITRTGRSRQWRVNEVRSQVC